MKKHIALICVLLALLLAACQPSNGGADDTTGGTSTQQTTAPGETTVPEDTTAPEETTEPVDEALVARFQELLKFDNANWYNRAMTHVFASPAEIDVKELFQSGFPGESQDPTAEEDAFLRSRWTEDGALELDLVRLPAGQMDAMLQQYFGISLAEIKGNGLDFLTYWDETDCYYYACSDSNAVVDFTVTNVTVTAEGAYRVAYDYIGEAYVITLQPNGDGYLVLSNERA